MFLEFLRLCLYNNQKAFVSDKMKVGYNDKFI